MNRYTCKRPEWSDENTDYCDCDDLGEYYIEYEVIMPEICCNCRWWQPEEE